MFERFTDRARRVLTLAQESARTLNHSFIGTEHLLLGLIDEGDGVAAMTLSSLGVTYDAARIRVEEIVSMAGTTASGSPPFTPRAKKVLELALREALAMNHNYIGTEHLLLGLIREGEGVATAVLVSLDIDLDSLRREVLTRITGPQGAEFLSTSGQSASTNEPRCPRCRGTITEDARIRRMVVPVAEGSGDPVSLDVVYCIRCGTTLHMFTP